MRASWLHATRKAGLPPSVHLAEGIDEVVLPEPVVQSRGGGGLNGPLLIRIVKDLKQAREIRAGLVVTTSCGADGMEWVAEGGWLALSAASEQVDESIWEIYPPAGAGELFLLHRRKVEPLLIPRVLHLLSAATAGGLEEKGQQCHEKWQRICGPD